MSKAAELAALIGSQTALSNRNLIINGAMQVAQRGTSFTGITGGQFNGPDRFMNLLQTAGTWTVSQSTTAPDGFGKSLKWECTTADASLASGDYFYVAQRMEGQNLQQLKKGTASAESVTLSFWVRSSKTGTYIAELEDRDNTRSISKSYTISSANTWEYKTLTFSGDTVGALDDDNNRSMDVNFWLAAGSTYTSGTLATSWDALTSSNRAVGQVNLADSTSNDWYITGVQLEVGEQATPFEHRSYADELRRCHRYFQYIESFTFTNSVTSDYNGTRFTRLQPMRVAPTDTIISTATEATGEIRYQDGAADVAASTSSKPESFNCYVNNASTAVGSNMFFRLKSDAEL